VICDGFACSLALAWGLGMEWDASFQACLKHPLASTNWAGEQGSGSFAGGYCLDYEQKRETAVDGSDSETPWQRRWMASASSVLSLSSFLLLPARSPAMAADADGPVASSAVVFAATKYHH
jgi:hypothetical protein